MTFFHLCIGILIFLILNPYNACAQVNIEKFRKEKGAYGFSGYMQLDISSRTGNVKITEITVENRSDYLWRTMTAFLIVRGDYGWQGGKQYSDEALMHLRHVFRSHSQWQPEVFAQIDYNKKRLLSFRGLIGGGLRCAVYQVRAARLWYGTSVMLEHERYDVKNDDSQEKEVNVVRWSNYLTERIEITERAALSSATYIQPCVDDFGDVRVLNETDLNIELLEKLSLVITLKIRYDSEPPHEIESLDTALGTGLALKF